MEQNDAQLIRCILQGDQDAFTALVKKYQKGAHALAWRKIGDFHVAQEITQDAFLNAYKKLGTLRNHNAFAGWLYVIVARLSSDWLRRNRLTMESLDTDTANAVDKVSYSQYVAEEQATEADETRREVVKELLKKLPESERTVMTLHYLGEMTIKAVSEFLGVSQNTVKSRLSRARNRLRKEEDVIQQNLGSFQLTNQLTENIMREVSRLSPVPAPTGKPTVPLALSATSAVLIFILMGVSTQYLSRFQKPYSFDAQSEPTIEIVDEPIYLEIVAKPAVRNQTGRTIAPGKNSGAGMQTSETRFTANASDDTEKGSGSQWTQAIGPKGSIPFDLFKASDGTIYAAAKTGIYKLASDTTWVLTNADIPSGQYQVPMTEHRGILYTVSTDEVFASENGGETWNSLGQRPKGIASGLIVTDAIQKHDLQADIALYLALQDEGIFRSTDGGKHWMPLNSGLNTKRVYTVAAIGNTIFAGTNRGLYRLDSSKWKQALTEASDAVYTLTVDENNLYVGITRDFASAKIGQGGSLGGYVPKRIFHSADAGTSWTEITPTNKPEVMNLDAAIQVLAAGKTLLILGISELRSTDAGKTWTSLRDNLNAFGVSRFPAVVADENTFYKVDIFGISRTTDAGETWHPFVNGMTGPATYDLITLTHRFYMHIGGDLVQSTDGGETWESVRFNTHEQSPKLDGDFYDHIKLTIADNQLYAISIEENKPSIFRTSPTGDELIPVHGVPSFEAETPPDDGDTSAYRLYLLRKKHVRIESFAVSRETFYAGHKERLFKWKPGDPQWTDTGLVDIGFTSTLMASGDTVYAGKTNGKLFQSLDSGESWRDITSTLPIRFTHFKDIIFLGSTICIATDKGVLISKTGEHWQTITDKKQMPTVIEKLAIDGSTIYGVGDGGAYRLDAYEDWALLSAEVPKSFIMSLAISNNRLYVGTHDHGMFHISLEEQMDIANSF